jgi:hypothetical protein
MSASQIAQRLYAELLKDSQTSTMFHEAIPELRKLVEADGHRLFVDNSVLHLLSPEEDDARVKAEARGWYDCARSRRKASWSGGVLGSDHFNAYLPDDVWREVEKLAEADGHKIFASSLGGGEGICILIQPRENGKRRPVSRLINRVRGRLI